MGGFSKEKAARADSFLYICVIAVIVVGTIIFFLREAAMIYLSEFRFPDADTEFDFFLSVKRTCYNTYYPFEVLSKNQLETVRFGAVTIFYGGNGSGKSTALNVIAEKLGLQRDTLYNRTNFFEDYTGLCRYELERPVPDGSRIITSDDVFDFMLNLRSLNEGIHRKREELFEEYLDAKYSDFQLRSLADYDRLKQVNQSRSRTQSRYVREHLMKNVREHSNGESAFLYFVEKVQENGLYLLDEPENSLSPAKQLELMQFLEGSARFYGCQLIIATHSPFLLSLRGARVYNFDETPVAVRKWSELSNVRAYYDFFKEHEADFSAGEKPEGS